MLRQKREYLEGDTKRQWDTVIFQLLQGMDIFKNAQTIGAFYPFENEVDIDSQLQMIGSEIAYPDFNSSGLVFYEGLEETTLTTFGLRKPLISTQTIVVPDILLIPVIAINSEGYRLGYGGGYYDRYLQKYPEVKTVALFYECQQISESFQETHDKKMGYGVSEKQYYYYK